jgi:hypothetical protein
MQLKTESFIYFDVAVIVGVMKMEEELVNEGVYKLYTTALQQLGVVEAEIRAYFDTSLVKKIAEFGEYVKIIDILGEYEILQVSDEYKEVANEIDKAIRKAAVKKAAATGVAKKVYEVVITADDVDFTKAERVLEEIVRL